MDSTTADDLALLANAPAQAESLRHSLAQTARNIDLYENENKTDYMCFNRERAISTLKLVDKFTYLGSSVSSTETDVNIRLAKVWTAIDRLLIIWKSDLSDKIKRYFL